MKTYSTYWCSVLKTSRLWPKLIYPPSKYIYRNDTEQTSYNRICWKGLNDTAKQYFICTTVILLTLFGSTVGPLYTYSKTGKITTLYELRIPFLENDPEMEFYFGFAWQGLVSCFGLLGLSLIESGMAVVNNSITVSSKLNVLSLHELSERLEANDITGRESLQKLKLIFKDIIYWDEYDLILTNCVEST